MGLKSLISYGFLILPAAVTISVLLGLQSYRESRGMSAPFVSNKVVTNTYCQLAFGITPATDGQQYTRESPCQNDCPHPISGTPYQPGPCQAGLRYVVMFFRCSWTNPCFGLVHAWQSFGCMDVLHSRWGPQLASVFPLWLALAKSSPWRLQIHRPIIIHLIQKLTDGHSKSQSMGCYRRLCH